MTSFPCPQKVRSACPSEGKEKPSGPPGPYFLGIYWTTYSWVSQPLDDRRGKGFQASAIKPPLAKCAILLG